METWLLAFGINLAWEIVQLPLYAAHPWSDLRSWYCCFEAALGDATIISALWLVGAGVFRRADWLSSWRPMRVLLLATTGFGVAVAIERIALRAGWWSYAADMPLVPIVGVGLSPALQLTVTPLIVLAITHRRWARSGRGIGGAR